ncbi:hypothetical protein [Actinacidiphila sp. ITFR-21]|uniref:hypothetical protein n=1 Tax=Actinacidiphila sp. ITFR-21 TaxID=3075199 RepID=UPI002889D835|nr:hypothetical protein [Streptomyces sp. ITFR-21]WNI15416.1 hypothetical protein RLT57_07665 [Streptomyces sp. ITFR-21]
MSVSERSARHPRAVHLPAPRAAPPDAPVPVLRRWPGYALAACGAALVPWLVVLATGLPPTTAVPHLTTAWVGLDAMEAVGLIATGLLTVRRHPVRSAAAAATAMLLVVDAWFDVMTSSGADLTAALLMAFAAELPLAAVCAALAVRAFPRPAAGAAGPGRDPGGSPAGAPGRAATDRLGREPVRRQGTVRRRQQPRRRPPR